ncbi:hypothetical protein B0H13DRAFT_1889761 [Mycena leptocephala]|nr:hypothetical protein B0H13DRAFT_1889761 [Mycena leptocephala]
MEDFLVDPSGNVVEPTWSKRDETWFCSFGATPESIPRDALRFKTPLPYLLKSTTSSDVLSALDYSKFPVWYNPEEHWLPWIPLGKPDWSDGEDSPLAYLFDTRPIPTEANYTSMYGTGSDSDDPMEPRDVFAGYFFEEGWQATAKFTAELLQGICYTLATTTVWYSTNRWMGATGDVPRKIDETMITRVHSSEEGFIAWFQTLIRLEDTTLHKEDRDYANFPHLIKNWVPIHVAWMEEEKKNWRFLRLNPEVWGEFSTAKASKSPGEEISLVDLPSGAAWRSKWERSDWFFQNKYAGKRGDAVLEFQPTWEYAIVDFHLWGARPLTNAKHIRAYAEHFKAAVTTTDRGTICTFFRQNPLGVDEPLSERVQPQLHVLELENFSLVTDSECVEEDDIYYEPSRTFNSFNGARELAPLDKSLRGNPSKQHVGRRQRGSKETTGSSSASSYGEAWSSSPLKERLGPITSRESRPSSRSAPRSGTPEDTALSTDWARKMAGERHRSSRSNSPRRLPSGSLRWRSRSLATERTLDSDHEGGNFAGEYAAASASEEGEVDRALTSAIPDVASQGSGDHPFSGPSPVHSWEPGFQTEEQAREAIEAWAPKVVELIPVYGSYPGLKWNKEWLADAILVCDDERSYWHLKAYAAIFKGFTKFEEILEVAIRMALPFAVYIKRSDVHKFSSHNISSLDLKTLGALYTPGYVDLPLVWTGPGGGPAVYSQYEGRVGSLLKCPEAIAFVPIGGVCRLQVSEFDEGESRKINRFSNSTFYTTDRVSNSEIFLLLGHIAGSDSSGGRTLWPTPEVFECESPHMRGYLSEGSYLILSNLRRDIIDRKRYKWRTYSQWKEYFRVGSKGDHEPKSIPKTKDFVEGAEMIKRAFPINWLDLDIGEIVLPEEFEPHAQRD